MTVTVTRELAEHAARRRIPLRRYMLTTQRWGWSARKALQAYRVAGGQMRTENWYELWEQVLVDGEE